MYNFFNAVLVEYNHSKMCPSFTCELEDNPDEKQRDSSPPLPYNKRPRVVMLRSVCIPFTSYSPNMVRTHITTNPFCSTCFHVVICVQTC